MRTLEQIQEQLAKLQGQAAKLIAQKSQHALDSIRALMLEHGLTTEDIEAKANDKRDVAASKRATAKTVSAAPTKDLRKGPFSVKYFDPKTGKSWTGRGRAPAWLATTRSKNKFLVDGVIDGTATSIETADSADVIAAPKTPAKKSASAAAKKSPAKKTATNKATVAKTATKSTLPAKYLDPKTGKSWSGRGPAPAWLANARNKNRFLVEGAEPATFGVPAKKTRKITKAAKADEAPTPSEVTVATKKTANKTVKKPSTGKKGQPTGAQAPKYLDPLSGKTWSGRGPAPAWLAAVEDRNVFLIDHDAASAIAS
jgi:DNA-binding protein H-NS